MSLHDTYSLLAGLLVLIAAALAVDWIWFPRPSAEDEARRRLNALASAGDEELRRMS